VRSRENGGEGLTLKTWWLTVITIIIVKRRGGEGGGGQKEEESTFSLHEEVIPKSHMGSVRVILHHALKNLT
jgi:hypothetical protein